MVEKTLNPRSELACLRAQQQLLEELAGGRPITQERWIENLACDSEQNTPDPIPLSNNLVLDPIDAHSSFAYLFDPPAGIPPGFSARIDPAPLHPVVFHTDGRQLALQTLPLREVPAHARSQIYTIILTSGGRDHLYRVILPVNLGMEVPLLPVFVPGASFDLTLSASGGPPQCDVLPPGLILPCGPMAWTWIPDQGGGSIPAGINLYTLPDGNARLSGTVQSGAISSIGRLHLDQGGFSTERQGSLRVPVHLAENGRETLFGPHVLIRGDTFTLRLPDALGGDGHTFDWRVHAGGSPLPPSLNVVRRGAEFWLEGRVDDAAKLGRHSVQLQVDSPLAPAPSLFTSHLDVSHRLRVWTQNSFLRPPDAFPSSFYTEIAPLLLSPLDVPFASSLLSAAAVIEAIYDLRIQNTREDNEERTNLILERAREFDLVALQEVFTTQAPQMVDGALAHGFFPLAGPGARTWRLPPTASIGAAYASLPLESSGLFLLVHRDLHDPQVPLSGLAGQVAEEAVRWAAFDHRSQVFSTCNGFIADGSDCLARKGFTMSKVHVGQHPDEFFFVVNTHLDAGISTADVTARATQLTDIATFVASATDGVHPILFMGDFNITGEIGSPAFAGPELAALIGALGGVDLYRLANPLMVGATVGYTVDSGLNAYAHHWGAHDPQNPTRERIDYLRVVPGTGFALTLDSIAVMGDALDAREQPRTEKCFDPELLSNGWVEANETLRCYFSDHFGIEAVLRLTQVPPSP
jgi:hypothetical protein